MNKKAHIYQFPLTITCAIKAIWTALSPCLWQYFDQQSCLYAFLSFIYIRWVQDQVCVEMGCVHVSSAFPVDISFLACVHPPSKVFDLLWCALFFFLFFLQQWSRGSFCPCFFFIFPVVFCFDLTHSVVSQGPMSDSTGTATIFSS